MWKWIKLLPQLSIASIAPTSRFPQMVHGTGMIPTSNDRWSRKPPYRCMILKCHENKITLNIKQSEQSNNLMGRENKHPPINSFLLAWTRKQYSQSILRRNIRQLCKCSEYPRRVQQCNGTWWKWDAVQCDGMQWDKRMRWEILRSVLVVRSGRTCAISCRWPRAGCRPSPKNMVTTSVADVFRYWDNPSMS